jgi:hypothetical protein
VDFLVGEVEGLVDQLLLGFLDLRGLGDQHPDLVLGVACARRVAWVDAEQADDEVGRLLHDPDQRLGDEVEAFERDDEPQHELLARRERERLRHELAEYDVEVRDDEQGDGEGGPRREPRVEDFREDRLADGADEDRERRHAELGRGDEADGIVEEADGQPRTPAAGVRDRGQSRPPRGHQRVLGRDEVGVPQHEQENGDDAVESCHAPRREARVLGGRSSSNFFRV